MKKNSVLYHIFGHIFGLFLIPVALVGVLTAIYSFATANYEYLPENFEFFCDLFFSLSDYAMDFTLFFCVGAFCFALYDRNTVSAIVCALLSLFNAGIIPMFMFFVRSIFLSAYSPAAVMEEYWAYDVYASMANFAKISVALVLALVVSVVYMLRKSESEFKKPYVLPKSEPAVAALVICAASLIFTTLVFTFGGVYDLDSFITLGIQVLVVVISYFVIVLGEYAHKRFAKKQ